MAWKGSGRLLLGSVKKQSLYLKPVKVDVSVVYDDGTVNHCGYLLSNQSRGSGIREQILR